MVRAFLVMLSLFLPVAALAQTPVRERDAEAFVSTKATEALRILNDKTLTLNDKARLFRGFVDETADVPRITGFVLGKYRRRLNADEYAEFSSLFREYAIDTYETRLNEYGGERLRVTGSTQRKPGDAVVVSVIEGGDLDKPQPVKWRVIKSGNDWRVVDVEVLGVWLAITQQQEFVALMDNAGGKAQPLLNELRDRLAKVDRKPKRGKFGIGRAKPQAQ
jgi:phospholipid transport system substrate-binding protein